MLEKNPEKLRSPDRAPVSSDGTGWCPFRPNSYVVDGVQVERQHILAGMVECSALPFLVVGVQDGPAVKLTQEGGDRMRSRLSVTGDVEICPAGFSGGAVTLDRSTDQIYIGIQPQVVSSIAEAAGADSRRVDSGSQDQTIYHVARRLLRERQASGLGGRLYAEALITELVIHLLRDYSSLDARGNGDLHGIDSAQLRPALEMIHDDLQANLSLWFS